MGDAEHVMELLNHRIMDVDYSKYENIKMAVQKRKSAGDRNKVRSKKILVTPLRAVHSVNGQSLPDEKQLDFELSSARKSVAPAKREVVTNRRCKSETKEVRSRTVSPVFNLNVERAKDILRNDKDGKLKKERRDSPVIVHEPNIPVGIDQKKPEETAVGGWQKTVAVKRCTKGVESQGGNISRRSSPKTVDVVKRGHSPKSALRNQNTKRHGDNISDQNLESKAVDDKPLLEVRRKLDFDNEADYAKDLPDVGKGFDFTDKLAALKCLISRDRIEKTISDRRAYYSEYQSSHRKVIVSRSDSCKENQSVENHNNNASLKESLLKEKKEKAQALKRDKTKSADIFKAKQQIDLAEVDLQVVKAKLREKQRKRDLERADKGKFAGPTDRQVGDNGEDLLHAVGERKILVSSRKSQMEGKKANDDVDDNKMPDNESRPDSRLESKETQTNQLNQSIRSVQSNVPFYEPSGRPASAPLFNCEIVVGKTKVYKPRPGDSGHRDYERTAKPRHTDKHLSDKEDRQSNVGTSLTPEKETLQHSGAKLSKESRRESRSRLTSRHLHSGNEQLISGIGNQRPSSRCSQMDIDDEVRGICSNMSKSKRSQQNMRSSSAINEELFRNRNDELMDKYTNKTERKVREWMKKQEMLLTNRPKSANLASKQLMMEELNVSISIPVDEGIDMKHSPADSCDRIPVKLEKPQKEKSHTLDNPPVTGYIETKNGSPDYLSNRQAIFDRLERITMAVTTKQHQFEVDIPVKDIKGREVMEVGRPQMLVEHSDSADTE